MHGKGLELYFMQAPPHASAHTHTLSLSLHKYGIRPQLVLSPVLTLLSGSYYSHACLSAPIATHSGLEIRKQSPPGSSLPILACHLNSRSFRGKYAFPISLSCETPALCLCYSLWKWNAEKEEEAGAWADSQAAPTGTLRSGLEDAAQEMSPE